MTISVLSYQSGTDCDTWERGKNKTKLTNQKTEYLQHTKRAVWSPQSSVHHCDQLAVSNSQLQLGKERYAKDRLRNVWKCLHQCKCCYCWQLGFVVCFFNPTTPYTIHGTEKLGRVCESYGVFLCVFFSPQSKDLGDDKNWRNWWLLCWCKSYQVRAFHSKASISTSKTHSEARGKKLCVGLEEGSFQSFLVVNLEYLATRAERGGVAHVS